MLLYFVDGLTRMFYTGRPQVDISLSLLLIQQRVFILCDTVLYGYSAGPVLNMSGTV